MAKAKYTQARERKVEKIVDSLDPLVKEWFFSKFKEFSLTQRYGVLPIFERKNILISAPTGSTKTLTAFLSILNYLVMLAKKQELEERIYAVYVSPLKALSNDIHFNLIEPLKEMQELAKKKGIEMQEIRVFLRTGDTSSKERAKMLKKSPHIIVTTPESLAIMINSPKFSERFDMVEWLVVDEIHAIAENKRGTHLSLTLERLQARTVMPITRIGLSATIAPLDEVANFLVGDRDCVIADVRLEKKLDLQVVAPVDFLNANSWQIHHRMYEVLDDLIQAHKTTLIFTNTRSATERVVHNLKEKFPGKYVAIDEEGDRIGAHHSSLSKQHRYDIEEGLRQGKLKVVVCSTSLELGIDIGYVDLVVLLGSPKSVSRAMQRIGRAGHKLHETAKGRFIVNDMDDLVESGVILRNAKHKQIDRVHIPENCLDVLSQHIYGMAIYRKWQDKEMLKLIKKAYPYRNLSKSDFYSVISYLTGEYELQARNVYAKIWYDKDEGMIGKRGRLARVIYMTNIGTIPDESFANVVCSGQLVGKVDEGFLERLKKGDVFVLGGQRYQFLYNKGMKIYVRQANEKRPTIPSWYSEMLPLSFDTALSIQHFRKLIEEKLKTGKSRAFIKEYIGGDDRTVKIMDDYFKYQYDYSIIPHEGKVLVEQYKEEKNYVIFHTLFGRRVNDALSRALGYVVASARKRDVEIGVTDNGFFIAGRDVDADKLIKGLKKLNADNLQGVLEEAVEKTEVLKRRFRHCAARGLMILRNYKGRQKSVGRQQLSSHFLLAAVRKTSKDFPILKEAKREVLEDLMDLNACKQVLDWFNKGKIKIEKQVVNNISPFAINILLSGRSDIIRIEDKIAFIKRIYKELESS
ncbi:MAG: ATP-dependent helicase [Candidatus Nanoarchaeia archaeon]